jgi:N-acetylglutamate synthase-like GNAT family acetyltransferase
MSHFEASHAGYTISTDPDLLDIGVIHRWLSTESYWAEGRSRETVERSVAASLNFGIYAEGGEMVGAARVVTDFATFGWLCDVFVLDAHRGGGLGKALMAAIAEHPRLTDLQRIILATADAHELYARHNFELMAKPERWMERVRPVS